MSTPIPITFSRELPRTEGVYHWRLGKGRKHHRRFVYGDAANKMRCMGTLVEDIGGEWCGPLQLIEAKDGATNT